VASAAEALRELVTDVSVKINVEVGIPGSSASARDVRFIALCFGGNDFRIFLKK